MAADVTGVLRDIRAELLEKPVSPRVREPADINRHYCEYVAHTVIDRLGNPADVRLLEDGGRGFAHVWIEQDGRHYDAERPEGVEDYTELPFFQRHPEAAVHVEPESVDLAVLRKRGQEPLYPD